MWRKVSCRHQGSEVIVEGLVEDHREANNHCSCNRGLLNSISEQTQHLQPGSSQTFLHLGPRNDKVYLIMWPVSTNRRMWFGTGRKMKNKWFSSLLLCSTLTEVQCEDCDVAARRLEQRGACDHAQRSSAQLRLHRETSHSREAPRWETDLPATQ